MHITRPQWRDALKDDEGLTEHEKFIGLLVADYWKADSVEPVWAAAEVLMRQSGLSRTMVFRALKGLRVKGYLNEVEKARPNRSPRWLPAVPEAAQCLSDTVEGPTDTAQCPEDHRNPTHTPSTPDFGSSDLDCESQPVFPEKPRDFAERRDLQKLADHMLGFGQHVDLVYGWIRTGFSPNGERQKPMRWPGGYATEKHKLPTGEEGISQWQGHFIRHYVRQDIANPNPPRAKMEDPWATSA